jgi:hypothetical protein
VAPNGAHADLATLTSTAENQFVFAGIDSSTFWVLDGAGNSQGQTSAGFSMT